MPPLFIVMLGGALGSGARYLTGVAALSWLGPRYPYGTLTVNLLGGLLMGLLAAILARHGQDESWRLFIGVGLLGGFTTFSAFSLDAALMIQRGALATALVYVLASVAGSIAALFLGLSLGRLAA